MTWLDAIWQVVLALLVGFTLLEVLPAGDWCLARSKAWMSSSAVALILGAATSELIDEDKRVYLLIPVAVVWFALWVGAPQRIRPRHDRNWTPQGLHLAVLAAACVLALSPMLQLGAQGLMKGLLGCAVIVCLDVAMRWRGASAGARSLAIALWVLAIWVLAIQVVAPMQALPALIVAAGTVWRTRADRRAQYACVTAIGLYATDLNSVPLAAILGAAFVISTPRPSQRNFALACLSIIALSAWAGSSHGLSLSVVDNPPAEPANGAFNMLVIGLLSLAAVQRWRARRAACVDPEAPSAIADPALVVPLSLAGMLVTQIAVEPVMVLWLLLWACCITNWRVREPMG